MFYPNKQNSRNGSATTIVALHSSCITIRMGTAVFVIGISGAVNKGTLLHCFTVAFTVLF